MRREGGGSVLLVLENSTHDTSNDVVQLFGPRLHWLLDKVSPTSPTIMDNSNCQSVLGSWQSKEPLACAYNHCSYL